MENKKFNQLSKKYFDYVIVNNPILASYLGIHKYDNKLPDVSRKSIMDEIKSYRTFLKEFKKIDEDKLSFHNKIDRQLAIHNLKLELFHLTKLRSWEKNPDIVDELGSALFVLFVRDFAPFEDRLKSIVLRVEKSKSMFDQIRKTIKHPVKLWTKIAIESCETFPMFLDEIEKASKRKVGDKKLLKRMEKAFRECKEDVYDYKIFLEDKLLPKSKEEFSIGDELFSELIKLRELGMEVDDILEFGKKSLRSEKRELKNIAKRINPKLSLKEVMSEVRSKHHKEFKLILKEYRDVCKDLKRFVKNANFADMPKNEKLVVVETPSFLRHTIPFAAYFPPAKFDDKPVGVYIVTPPSNEEEFSKFSHSEIKNTCVHEAYPGHHLQMSAANTNKSLIRVLVDATEFVEGWAFYCEDTVVDLGIEESLEDQLMKTYGMVWRAARIVVDIMLATGKMTFDEGVRFLVKNVGMDKNSATAEVKRYTQGPGYNLSYYLGKYLIKKLREEMEEKFKDDFNIKKFHDSLIYNGSFPVKYHKMVLEKEFSE